MVFQQIVLIILVSLITMIHVFKPSITAFHVAGRDRFLDESPPVRSSRSVVRLALALRVRGQHRRRDDRHVDVEGFRWPRERDLNAVGMQGGRGCIGQ